jgi:hypothetical protein
LPLSPEEKRAQAVAHGRLGGLAKSAANDGREGTRKARTAFLARFEREVDPDGVLPLKERLRRADAAKKLYFARLYLKRRSARISRSEPAA